MSEGALVAINLLFAALNFWMTFEGAEVNYLSLLVALFCLASATLIYSYGARR